jgi:hypothetical protein
LDTLPLATPLISIHFPKTGGSSFRTALVTAYGETAVLSLYDCDPADPSNPLWIYPDWFLRNRPRDLGEFKVVHGHLPIKKFDLLPSAYRVVMLREPVENLISIYYFWRSLFASSYVGHAIYEMVKNNRLSLLEVAEIPRMRRLMSDTYFGDYDMRRFDVIGTYDNRIWFIRQVSNLIGITLTAHERENVTPPSEERDNLLSDTLFCGRIRDLLVDDIRFYEAHAGRSLRL